MTAFQGSCSTEQGKLFKIPFKEKVLLAIFPFARKLNAAVA